MDIVKKRMNVLKHYETLPENLNALQGLDDINLLNTIKVPKNLA